MTKKNNGLPQVSELQSNISTISITMIVGGVKKDILGFKIKNNGDVMMLLRHAQAYREAGTGASIKKLPRIKQQRYTLHQSLQSKEKINVIKQTLSVKGHPDKNTYLFTPVIKDKSGFVPIFSRRLPALNTDQYNYNETQKIKEECLGEFDANKSMLFLSVFVGAPELEIPTGEYYANIHSVVIGGFRILFVWCYMMLPSHPSGFLVHKITQKNPDGTVGGQVSGLNMETAVAVALYDFYSSIEELGKTLHVTNNLPINFAEKSIELTGFVKNPLDEGIEIKAIKNVMQVSQEHRRLYETYTSIRIN